MLKVKVIQAIPSPLQINMECGAGELHALVGPSGSGKTSVLRTIAGLSHPHSGRIECDNELWFEGDELHGAIKTLAPSARCGSAGPPRAASAGCAPSRARGWRRRVAGPGRHRPAHPRGRGQGSL